VSQFKGWKIPHSYPAFSTMDITKVMKMHETSSQPTWEDGNELPAIRSGIFAIFVHFRGRKNRCQIVTAKVCPFYLEKPTLRGYL
jgi:hypothetical protein